MGRPGRIFGLACLVGVAVGCSASRVPGVTPAEGPVTEATVSFSGRARLEVVPVAPYVRVQPDRPTWTKLLPIIGDLFANWSTYETETVRFDEAFERRARAFLRALWPQGRFEQEGDEPVRVELSLIRSAFSRRERRLRHFMRLRVRGPLGTVLYDEVVTPEASGDVVKAPQVAREALDRGFALLADAVSASRPEIEASIALNQRSIADLESLLLAGSRSRGVPNAGSIEGGRLYAVVIGISAYDARSVPPLPGAGNDAERMFSVLNDPRNRMGADVERMALLIDDKAKARYIREALSRWLVGVTTERDTVVVYFSGHGVYRDDPYVVDKKEKYFLAADFHGDPTDPLRYEAGAIPMEEVIDYFGRLKAARVIMVFDACHAGAAQRDDRTDELERFVHSGSLSRLNMVLAAARQDQRSYEIDGRGVFTKHVVGGLQGRADADGDGKVTVAELARHVSQSVSTECLDLGVAQDPVWATNSNPFAEEASVAAFGAP